MPCPKVIRSKGSLNDNQSIDRAVQLTTIPFNFSVLYTQAGEAQEEVTNQPP